jgi:hypothetical protein
MRHVLIVANQTLGGPELQREIEKRASESYDFWVVVPATPASDLAIVPKGLADPDGSSLAEARLATELERLKAAGVTAGGEIGDPDPIHAIKDALMARECDEIILATLPQGVSRWLRQDLVSRVQRRFSPPVTHVVSTSTS